MRFNGDGVEIGFEDDHTYKTLQSSLASNGSYIKVKHRCLVSFTIGKHYKDEIWCDVFPMDACHLLLRRP